jgi:pantoate--beta-alanine ligase
LSVLPPDPTTRERTGGIRVVTSRAALREAVTAVRGSATRDSDNSIGLVPTMGALHAGHLSLVAAARRACGFTIVTIFVNPTQFGPQEDFQKYPRTLESDLAQLAPLGVDLVFAPPVEEVYRPGHATHVELAGVAEPLEGRLRPGHFRGVATVVLKLFNMTTPDVAFFGQKDYQQSLVILRLIEDLDLNVKICVCPIVREPDGLALSSRNAYLDSNGRRQALALVHSLTLACDLFGAGQRDAAMILARMRESFSGIPGIQLEYLTLADANTLSDVREVDGRTVALVAARVGNVRLIDNCFLGERPTAVANL